MLMEERREHVLCMLEEKSAITVAELVDAFGISEVSVRKLLDAMQKEGILKRTWGGAVSASGSLREYSQREKEPRNLKEKQAIARAAYQLIDDGDAVFLDCGTTNFQLVKEIVRGDKRNLLVATNAVNFAVELAKAEDLQVLVVGGELRHKILSCVGALAEEILEKLFFDKGFISGNHMTAEHGFTTPTLSEAKVKRQMMRSCKEHFIVLDHSKFGDDSLAQICPAGELHALITDWRTPRNSIQDFLEKGVRVIQGVPEER